MTVDGGWLAEERPAGEPEWGDVAARRVESGVLAETLRALEALVGGPVDAEYALSSASDGRQCCKRGRARAGPLEAVDAAFAGFAEPGRWRLDVEHNPRPLSPAQAEPGGAGRRARRGGAAARGGGLAVRRVGCGSAQPRAAG